MAVLGFELAHDMVCQHLDDLQLGVYAGGWNTYLQDKFCPPIFIKHQPAEPARCITVNVYAIDADPNPEIDSVIVRFQVKVRDEYDADMLADRIAEAINGTHHERWAGIRVARCTRISTAQLGLDASGLDERTDNYQLITGRTPL